MRTKGFVLLLAATGLVAGILLVAVALRSDGPVHPALAAALPAAPAKSPNAGLLQSAPVPAQFLAKLYTEALGRIPTLEEQDDWQAWLDTLAQQGCARLTLRDMIYAFYTGPEFMGRDYDRAARLLALYRGALNQEPAQPAFSALLQRQEEWTDTVTYFLDDLYSDTLALTLTDAICNIGEPPFYQEAPYGWGASPVITLPVTGPYTTNPWVFCGAACNETGADLQQLLTNAITTTEKTVYLAQKAVVWVTETLVIPGGVTLTTWFTDTPILPAHYAKMGRLVRNVADPYFISPVALLETDSTLQGVWVDGQYARRNPEQPLAPFLYGENVRVVHIGTSGVTHVVGNRISDAWGIGQVRAAGWLTNGGRRCQSVVIAYNLVTGYAHEHYLRYYNQQTQKWVNEFSDGIDSECEATTIAGNQIVDASDVGIGVYRTWITITQASLVSGNILLNAGNSGYAAIAPNGLSNVSGTLPATTTYDFRGLTLTHNLFWTGPTAHLDIALAIGTREWYRTAVAGRGAAAIANTTGILTVTTTIPIAVSGMREAVVCSNTLQIAIVRTCCCNPPSAPEERPLLVSTRDGWGSLVTSTVCPVLPLYEEVGLPFCINHYTSSDCRRVFLPLLFQSQSAEERLLPAPPGDYPEPPDWSEPAPRPGDDYPPPP